MTKTYKITLNGIQMEVVSVLVPRRCGRPCQLCVFNQELSCSLLTNSLKLPSCPDLGTYYAEIPAKVAKPLQVFSKLKLRYQSMIPAVS